MSKLTPSEARNYLHRWSLVREAETDDLRNTPMEIKARQLATLMASRGLFKADPTRDEEIIEVRARWAKIRSVLSG